MSTPEVSNEEYDAFYAAKELLKWQMRETEDDSAFARRRLVQAQQEVSNLENELDVYHQRYSSYKATLEMLEVEDV